MRRIVRIGAIALFVAMKTLSRLLLLVILVLYLRRLRRLRLLAAVVRLLTIVRVGCRSLARMLVLGAVRVRMSDVFRSGVTFVRGSVLLFEYELFDSMLLTWWC